MKTESNDQGVHAATTSEVQVHGSYRWFSFRFLTFLPVSIASLASIVVLSKEAFGGFALWNSYSEPLIIGFIGIIAFAFSLAALLATKKMWISSKGFRCGKRFILWNDIKRTIFCLEVLGQLCSCIPMKREKRG